MCSRAESYDVLFAFKICQDRMVFCLHISESGVCFALMALLSLSLSLSADLDLISVVLTVFFTNVVFIERLPMLLIQFFPPTGMKSSRTMQFWQRKNTCLCMY